MVNTGDMNGEDMIVKPSMSGVCVCVLYIVCGDYIGKKSWSMRENICNQNKYMKLMWISDSFLTSVIQFISNIPCGN